MELALLVDEEEATAKTWTMLWPLRRVHEASDRLFVVECDGEAAAAVRGLPGVTAPRAIDDGLAGRLTATERLFLAGWLAKGASAGKARPRDGEAWDAKGRTAP